MNYPPTLLCDFYKISHREQYPEKTQIVYSTWTPRTTRIPRIQKIVAAGFQRFIKKWLINYFNENFFNRSKEEVVAEYARVIKHALFVPNPYTKHIEDLHDLKYLPIKIKAVPEGFRADIRTPVFTIENTLPEFFWLTNYFETLLSCEMWHVSTVASIAYEYRQILSKYAMETVGDTDFVKFQGHDFSMRGMEGVEAGASGNVGHLFSFVGTDTIPSILECEYYYGANIETELVGCSVPATEHSVMCAGGADNEFETYKRLITQVYPSGIVSIVSDTWDLWHVITDTLAKLKDDIMARDGKVVIRPDSGDPVDIICGTNSKIKTFINKTEVYDFLYELDEEEEARFIFDGICYIVNRSYTIKEFIRDYGAEQRFEFKDLADCVHRYGYMDIDKDYDPNTPAAKGVIELLWDIFGGTVSEQGYKILDSHIGAIYGDSITLDRCEAICERLKSKGFASVNTVYGIGSYTYQYQTRDTFGYALKSTYVKIDGIEYNIYKDPVTDDGTKKSQTGKVIVAPSPFEAGKTRLIDGLNAEQENNAKLNLLQPIFEDGKLLMETTLSDIRKRLGFS